MRQNKWFFGFERVLFFVNILASVALLTSYILPYISPKNLPILAVLSLGFPIFFFINLVFAIYWLLRFKKYMWLSGLTILIGFGYINNLVGFSKSNSLKNGIKVMSYNVKGFSLDKKNKKDSLSILTFIKQQKPHILVLQEHPFKKNDSLHYPFSYSQGKGRDSSLGLAIFSQYPIINKGSLDFKDSPNNSIYADLLINKDTVRVYNVHLQSLALSSSERNFDEENSEKILAKMKYAFLKQIEQVEALQKHQKQWKGKNMIVGDFNNTAFSWVYRQLKDDKVDAFEVAGNGLGKTYDYPFPLRIDFMLLNTSFMVDSYKTFSIKNSDHFPIMASFTLSQ